MVWNAIKYECVVACQSLENYEYEMNKFTPEWRKNVAGFFKKRIVDICGKVQLKEG